MKHIPQSILRSFHQNTLSIRVSLLALGVTLLAGCGGPKYQDDFREWLSLHMASVGPVKLENIQVEEITSGSVETVFLFQGTIMAMQDLFTGARLPEQDALREAVNSLRSIEATSSPEGREAMQKANELLAISALQVATRTGTKTEFSGRAKAIAQNDGSWGFQVLELTGGDLPGDRPSAGSRHVVMDTSEGKDHLVHLREQTEMVKGLIEQARLAAEQKQREEEERLAEEQRQREEEERRVAAEAQARLDAFLVTIAPKREIIGVWQGTDASGEIGLRFGEHRKMPDSYSIHGEIFDPANQNQTKPFQGNLSGDGSSENPFTLDLIAGKNGESDWRKRNAAHNKTAAFLLPTTRFGIVLQPSGEGGFGGQLKMIGAFRDHPDNPHVNFGDYTVPVVFSVDSSQ